MESYKCNLETINFNDSTVSSFLGLESMFADIDAQQLSDVATKMSDIGLPLDNAVLLISLMFVNAIAVIFILIGLYLYENRIKFKTNISYTIFIIVGMATILIASTNLETPIIYCNYISLLDIIQCSFCAFYWYFWCTFSCKGKCKKYFKYVMLICIILMMPIFGVIIPLFADINVALIYGSLICCHFLQPSIFIVLTMMVNKELIVSKYHCKNKLCRNICFCFGAVIAEFLREFTMPVRYACSNVIGLIFNPFIIISAIYLFFSDAKYFVLCYLLMGMISVIFDITVYAICWATNLILVLYSIFTPILMVLLFLSLKELKEWKFGLISMYLSLFDIATDIVVISQFIQNKDYQFVALLCLFIFSGQIMGSFADNFSHLNDKLTKTDKIISLIGFSRIWFLINSWSEQNEDRKYLKLYNKHKIWEIMFESFPTITFETYALILNVRDPFSEINLFALYFSIFFSLISVTYNVWQYFVTLTHQNRQIQNIQQLNTQNESTSTEKPEIGETERDLFVDVELEENDENIEDDNILKVIGHRVPSV
eukprot:233744_1